MGSGTGFSDKLTVIVSEVRHFLGAVFSMVEVMIRRIS